MDNSSLPAAGAAPESGLLENGKIWLNTASVVDRLIRDFTVEALDLVTRDDFMAQLDFRCRAMNDLFLGITPSDEYQTGPWNSPDQCGTFVLRVLRIEGETRLAVRDAFMIYFNAVLDVIEPDGNYEPEAVFVPLIANLRDALLGLSESAPTWAIKQ